MATEQSIIDGLFRDYGSPRFRDVDYHGYDAVPRNIRMFLSMRVLESEITNGGLAQFLWNVFFHWRVIAEDCAFAYAAIGAKPQAEAMPEIIRILATQEANCGEYVARCIASKDFSEFQAWCAVGESVMDLALEPLFYDSDALDTLRQGWISSCAP